MKIYITILATLVFCFVSNAQSIANFSIDSGGLIITNSNIKMIYTIGEVNVQESTIGNISLSEGFINSNIVSETLGVDDDNFLEDQISIFPNPVTEIININSTLTIEGVELFDILGKKLIVSVGKKQLNIDYLSSGIYLLKIFSEKGTVAKKIIIDY